MTLLITGAAGFIGNELARQLLQRGKANDASGSEFAIERLVLADSVQPRTAETDPRVHWRRGDVSDPHFVHSLVTPDVRAVFHLAGVLSGASEADIDLGMRVNLDGTRHMLDACRALPSPARLVFTSSIGSYGVPLPDEIDDDTPNRPTMSYGTQKLMCEFLVADYSRRGLIDGRSVRLSGIVVRPRSPSGALSAFNSDLIREPLSGNDFVSPVSSEGLLWVMSNRRCVENLMLANTSPAEKWQDRRGVLLPAVTVSVGEIVDALARAAGENIRKRIHFEPDAAIERQFACWPRKLRTARATAIGFAADASVDRIILDYLAQA